MPIFDELNEVIQQWRTILLLVKNDRILSAKRFSQVDLPYIVCHSARIKGMIRHA
ncbi:hypothetical protein JCM19233_7316 [Vibrio astriarenae]|nr:hypothetical protein JCM19233_7316 [Vibrio sp. C7]